MSDDRPDVSSRWAPFVPSLVAGVSVPLWIVFATTLNTVISGLAPGATPDALGLQLSRVLDFSNLVFVGFALALVFSFWLVAPVTRELRLTQVLLRSTVAAAVTVVVLFPVQFGIYSLLFAEQDQSQLVGIVQQSPPPDGPTLLAMAALSSVQFAIARLPLIALAALASWAWQRGSTPHGET